MTFFSSLFGEPSGSATRAELRQLHAEPRSFGKYLPFVDFDQQFGVFVFEDGVNCGALINIIPVATEAVSESRMADIAHQIQAAIRESIPENEESPWIIQLYASNEPTLSELSYSIAQYIKQTAKHVLNTKFTQAWLKTLDDHFTQVSQPHGIFRDEANDNKPWRGKIMHIRCTLYRKGDRKSFQENAEACNNTVESFRAALIVAGVNSKRAQPRDLITWLYPWFHPNPREGSPYATLKADLALNTGDDADVRGQEQFANYDLADLVLAGSIRSEAKTGTWHFDEMPHRCLTLGPLLSAPAHGHTTGERQFGNAKTTLLDKLPEGSVIAMTIIVQPQYQIKGSLDGIMSASRAPTPEAALANAEAKAALSQMADGNKMFPMDMVVYLRGKNHDELNARTIDALSVLRGAGMRFIDPPQDLFALHKYVQALPFVYDFKLDQRRTNRSRLTYVSQLSRLAPLYGRSTGTGNPGLVFFNRGAEPCMFDPIRDRKRNAHGFVFGPTGSGKSAFVTNLILQLAAVHRPRFFIIDPSQSFRELGDYMRDMGFSVNYMRLGAANVTMNPYSDAHKLKLDGDDGDSESDEGWTESDTDDDVERDLLGEMELITLTMITGGEAREAQRYSRGDRALLRDVIRLAVRTVRMEVKASGTDRRVIPSDMLDAMRALGTKHPQLLDMANAYSYFTGQDSFTGKLFDSQGQSFPEADVTIIEFGSLTKGERLAEQTVALMSVMNEIHAVVEKYANERRPTIILQDEGHLVTKNPMLSPYVIKIVKLWRKLGAWYWFITQDLEDVSDHARPLLNNLEYLIALQMADEDIAHLAKYRTLTEEDKLLLKAPMKQPGDYSEGVLIRNPGLKLLIRSVMPPIALALAGTEKEERVLRHELMAKHDLKTMLEANLLIAEQIKAQRAIATLSGAQKKW